MPITIPVDPEIPIVVVQEVAESPTVLVTEGGRVGPKGQDGKPGIIVSSTPPNNPALNDLWLQV